MKKLILMTLISSFFVQMITPEAQARHRHHRGHHNDRDWATAGKVMAGVLGVGLITSAIVNSARSEPTYYEQRPCHYYRGIPVAYPEPIRQRWVPGHYAIIEEQVWFPGASRSVWIPPQYEWREFRGRRERVLIQDGYYRYDTEPGHYELVQNKTWVEGHWENC